MSRKVLKFALKVMSLEGIFRGKCNFSFPREISHNPGFTKGGAHAIQLGEYDVNVCVGY